MYVLEVWTNYNKSEKQNYLRDIISIISNVDNKIALEGP